MSRGEDAPRRPARIPWAVLLGILALALAFRLVAHPQMAAAADTFAPIVDSEAYLLQALRVAAGRDVEEGVYFQAPLYPLLLGGAMALAGVPGATGAESTAELPPALLAEALRAGRLLNLLLGLAAVVLVWRTAHVLGGRGAGLAAGLLAALFSPFVFFEGLLLKGSLSLLFLPWAVLAAARAWRLGSPRAFAWCGLALGLGGLVRANLMPLAVLGAVALAVWGLRAGRAGFALRSGAALLLGLAAALAPVVVRNSLVAGRPVLSTAAGGTAFYQCNHPDNSTGLMRHTPLVRQVPRHELADFTALAEEREGRALSPGEVSGYWFRATLAGIAERPGTWLLAELRKLGLLFSRYEPMDNSMPDFAASAAPALGWSPVRYGLVLPLALGGVALAWRRRRTEDEAGGRAALLLAICGYAGTLLLFVVSSRYRLPLVPLVLVCAGYLASRLVWLLRAGERTDRRVVGGAVLGGLLLSFASEGPLGPIDARERATDWVVCLMNRAQVAVERADHAAGRGERQAALAALDRARSDLREAVARAAAGGVRSARLHAELGGLDRLQAQFAGDDEPLARALRESARAELGAALRIAPGEPSAQRQLGMLLYDEDRLAEAAERFALALEAMPRDHSAHQYRALALLQLGRAEEAESHAAWLTLHAAGDDDGWGLLAWARWASGRREEARAALERYDRLASMREAAGLSRRLPELPLFAAIRAAS